MKLLEGKTAIITGATRGIGKGIAKVFAEHGANIAFTYASSESKAKELENELSSIVKIKGYKSDASDFNATQKLIDDVLAEFGNIDTVVNNAGITKDNLILRMSKEEWDEVLRVNLDSVFNLTKAVTKPMMKQKKGSIINMSSVVGIKGNAGQSNYAASKAGIIGFSKSIALELGSRNIRCNVVAPGFIETEMTEVLDEKIIQEWRNNIPLKRGGTPEDIANACLYLASDLSNYVTGHVLNVNGGLITY
ncbi:3-oxoacyl-[acyl-carrier-protein] reductase [Apibacter muscae]|uniref:3-oxoacyl-[acyl-carrier-protein] reductase n=1 Tax=Apibacter muscae TaxID=2509004 RepID=UPI0011ABB6DD|nr:3-oxoacyl-[acyl-carrier-protein] reductase [Apibacter muscae]TWP29617.1 3-oxoacyl-[acyl-carrier-protein] reductase [Apibacter muscae]